MKSRPDLKLVAGEDEDVIATGADDATGAADAADRTTDSSAPSKKRRRKRESDHGAESPAQDPAGAASAMAAPPAPEAVDSAEPLGEQSDPAAVVEAVLFASDNPLAAAAIAQICGGGTARDVKQHIATLNQHYEEHGRAFHIEEIAGGFQMLTLPQFNGVLSKLLRVRQESRLSRAALETLAIVAYKQPVLRADVEVIRGVACGEMLNRLRELDLIKIVGRAEDVGRPILYGTTKKFLEVFGLGSLEDLPSAEELIPPAPG